MKMVIFVFERNGAGAKETDLLGFGPFEREPSARKHIDLFRFRLNCGFFGGGWQSTLYKWRTSFIAGTVHHLVLAGFVALRIHGSTA
jgi:hypothetical protein